MTDPTTEPDEQLVEAVARAVIDLGADPRSDEDHEAWHAVARAAIAAVRAYDSEREPFASQSIERPGLAPVITLVWPRGRAEALWVSAASIEAFAHRVEVRG